MPAVVTSDFAEKLNESPVMGRDLAIVQETPIFKTSLLYYHPVGQLD